MLRCFPVAPACPSCLINMIISRRPMLHRREERRPATTRCCVETDAGTTIGSDKGATTFCLHFARGCCRMGYTHITPLSACISPQTNAFSSRVAEVSVRTSIVFPRPKMRLVHLFAEPPHLSQNTACVCTSAHVFVYTPKFENLAIGDKGNRSRTTRLTSKQRSIFLGGNGTRQTETTWAE